jgi:pseudaminic acid cytidylyltransferase
MNVAIIPARGGSKRIPRKNIRDFCGKPMMAWPIEAARESGCFDRIVVSTDDEEIAAVARAWGAEVPFMRPAKLADDHATTLDVMEHALQALSIGEAPDFACCIYATTPFLAPSDLREGLAALQGNAEADYAVSVARFESPIQRALRRNAAGFFAMIHPEFQQIRSQDLEPAFHDAGQFYWGRAIAWSGRTPILAARALGIELPRERAQDIDWPEDWAWCERLFVLGGTRPAP